MIREEFPNQLISCSGSSVGLPDGVMGNSEVGHLNIGAGRIVYQDLTRITKAIDDGDFFNNPAFLRAIENCRDNNTALHLMGLTSDGGVHSSRRHYEALLKLARDHNLEKVYFHCFLDGRDTPPQSAADYVKALEAYMKQAGVGRIATVSGRYYAMDRDKRYERVKLAYDALVCGEGKNAQSACLAIEKSYADGLVDEFVLPTVISGVDGRIKDGDSVIFFNFRADRARQLARALTAAAVVGFERKVLPNVTFVAMTEYDESLKNLDVAFSPTEIKNTLGEYLSNTGKRQLRIAETEKYAHVTYFFNGGVEKTYAGEDRVLIPSPKVATYDMQPEMNAAQVTDAVTDKINETAYDFVLVNYANCDMVGHTGNFEAAVKAVEAVDGCVGRLYGEACRLGYTMLITADHGNAEQMMLDGVKFTAHTTNKVMFAVTDKHYTVRPGGSLCDIAPTVLKIMGLEPPAEMSGKSLI
jgi:2,3-bisphosphoglycerate-independent phosphoglycerate mutase